MPTAGAVGTRHDTPDRIPHRQATSGGRVFQADHPHLRGPPPPQARLRNRPDRRGWRLEPLASVLCGPFRGVVPGWRLPPVTTSNRGRPPWRRGLRPSTTPRVTFAARKRTRTNSPTYGTRIRARTEPCGARSGGVVRQAAGLRGLTGEAQGSPRCGSDQGKDQVNGHLSGLSGASLESGETRIIREFSQFRHLRIGRGAMMRPCRWRSWWWNI